MKKDKLLVILALCGMSACSLGIGLNSQGVFFSPVAESLNVGRGAVSLYNTISALTTAVGTVFLSKILDKNNIRRVVLISTISAVAAMMGFSFANSLLVYYICGFVMGLSLCVFAPAIISIILNNSINENVGLYTGIIFSFSGITGAVCSPVFSAVIHKYGIRYAYICMAIIFLVMSMPANICQLDFGNKTVENREHKFNYNLLFFSLVVAFALFQIAPAMTQHFVGFAQTKGLDSGIGSLMVSAGMVGNISFKLIAGKLSDMIGTFKTAILMILCSVLSSLLLVFSSNSFILLILAVLFGSIYALTSVMTPLISKEFYDKNDYRIAYPIIVFVGATLNAFATSLIGFAYDFTGSYNVALYIIIFLELVSTVILFKVYSKS